MPMMSPSVEGRVDGLADVQGVGAHLEGQCERNNHVARVRTHPAPAQDLAVVVRLGLV